MWEQFKARMLVSHIDVVLILVCVEVSVGVFDKNGVEVLNRGLNPCLCGS